MPRFKVESSLHEPVTIELEDGRILESVDFSDLLFRKIAELDKLKNAGTLDGIAYIVLSVALVFGVKREDLETVDIRVLGKVIAYVGEVMVAGKAGMAMVSAPSPMPDKPVDEVTAEKNAPKPGSEPMP